MTEADCSTSSIEAELESWSLTPEGARSVMGERAFDYCAGGAGDEAALRRNTDRLNGIELMPRVLRGVRAVTLSIELFGDRLAAPILVAPMGLQGLCHPAAEVATAAAAAELGVGFCLSTFSSRRVEEVVRAAPDVLMWQQLYLLRDRSVSYSLLGRAEAAGARAVVCTVDVPVVGRRDRDQRNGFRRFEAEPPALTSDPRFLELLADRREHAADYSPDRLVAELFPDPSISWKDVEQLRARTELPLLLKGILHPADARSAVEAGVDGVIVSTHGGRQLDRQIAAIDALPAVVDAVAGRIPVLFDSGVRRGSHVLVALAAGATAVLMGRPLLWGLAVAGQAGVQRVLTGLLDELTSAMTLVGAGSVTELDRQCLVDARSSTGSRS